MLRIGKPAALLVQLMLLALAPSALADTSPEDRAAADALFSDAAKLAQDNRWSEACPKLEASVKLDPAIGAILRLAECYEKTGRTASAWTTLHDAYDLARKANDKRMKEAEERAKQIEPMLARIVFDVAPENRRAGMEIRRDGTLLDAGAWNTPVPVDAGDHVIEASQLGKQTWQTTVTIGMSPGTTTVKIPPLADSPTGSGAAPRYWNGVRVAGATVGGVGLASALAAAVFGGVSLAKKNSLASDCHGANPEVCNAAGVALHDQALTMANASNVALAIGGGALITGVAVFLTAPKDRAAQSGAGVTVTVTAGVQGLRLDGRW